MFFIVNDPGPWQSYVKRADNIGLPLMEVKQKYLKEQALFEAEQRRQYNEYIRMIKMVEEDLVDHLVLVFLVKVLMDLLQVQLF